MRSIQFRAFHKEKKIFFYSQEGDGGWWGDCVVDVPEEYEEIQQFTGLKDKNGKEIFEGDIIKVKPESYRMGLAVGPIGDEDFKTNKPQFVISWGEKESAFKAKDLNRVREFGLEEITGVYLWVAIWEGSEAEIIGNIWETPELLKENI